MKPSHLVYLSLFLLSFQLTSCRTNAEEEKPNEDKYKTISYKHKNAEHVKMNPSLREAEDLLTEEKYKEAIAKFNESDSIYGASSKSLIDKALCYTKSGDYKTSLALNTEYIEKYNDDIMGWSNRGMVYIRLGEYQLALDDFDKAIELEPEEAALYYNRSIAYANLENKLKMCLNLRKALDLGYTEKYDSEVLDKYSAFCK